MIRLFPSFLLAADGRMAAIEPDGTQEEERDQKKRGPEVLSADGLAASNTPRPDVEEGRRYGVAACLGNWKNETEQP